MAELVMSHTWYQKGRDSFGRARTLLDQFKKSRVYSTWPHKSNDSGFWTVNPGDRDHESHALMSQESRTVADSLCTLIEFQLDYWNWGCSMVLVIIRRKFVGGEASESADSEGIQLGPCR